MLGQYSDKCKGNFFGRAVLGIQFVFLLRKSFPILRSTKPCHGGGSRRYLSIWEGGDPIGLYCIIVIYLTGTDRSKRSSAEMQKCCNF